MYFINIHELQKALHRSNGAIKRYWIERCW